MKVLNDFLCESCGTTEEHLLESNLHTVRCKCGAEAQKVITSMNFSLDPLKGHFPTATDKWAQWQEQRRKKANLEDAEHG